MKPDATLALDVLECNDVAVVYVEKHICRKPNSPVFTSAPLIETDKELTNNVITTRSFMCMKAYRSRNQCQHRLRHLRISSIQARE
jgi:hypothetical protein